MNNPAPHLNEQPDTEPQPTPNRSPRRRWSVNSRVGTYAGVVLAILGCFGAASIIWGLLRPRYQATIIDDHGSLELNMVDNVEFTGFFWFVFATGILAVVLSTRVHQRTIAYRGLGMLLWVTVWSFIGSLMFAKLGDFITIVVYNIPTSTSDFAVGDVVPYVPLMNVGISGYAVAPCLAAAYYWILEFFVPYPAGAGDTAAQTATAPPEAAQPEGAQSETAAAAQPGDQQTAYQAPQPDQLSSGQATAQ